MNDPLYRNQIIYLEANYMKETGSLPDRTKNQTVPLLGSVE